MPQPSSGFKFSLSIADRHGMGDRIDRRCRWAFPLVYAVLLAGSVAIAFLSF